MADINHVVLVGRLTRDAALKFTGFGTRDLRVFHRHQPAGEKR